MTPARCLVPGCRETRFLFRLTSLYAACGEHVDQVKIGPPESAAGEAQAEWQEPRRGPIMTGDGSGMVFDLATGQYRKP